MRANKKPKEFIRATYDKSADVLYMRFGCMRANRIVCDGTVVASIHVPLFGLWKNRAMVVGLSIIGAKDFLSKITSINEGGEESTVIDLTREDIR